VKTITTEIKKEFMQPWVEAFGIRLGKGDERETIYWVRCIECCDMYKTFSVSDRQCKRCKNVRD